ncbi:type III-B CRISPR-associated protein Cas10/Cmr2 [Peptococcaceae bacterium 1198_IL3148]
MKTLHFTLGPVQSFVAQARRTRDLHAGSFLLSYLVGQAMYEIIISDGKIIFPEVHGERGIVDQTSDPLLQAINRHSLTKAEVKGPSLGTLPNRFQAEVPDDFNPICCEKAVNRAWHRISESVWQEYVEKIAGKGKDVRKIWDRQVNKFWEMSWVIGQDKNLLDRRKNWRTYVPSVEPGDKCTIMGCLQELSGYLRSKQSENQNQFWEALRSQVKSLDLQEGERLCAISLIKRLFPRVSKQAIGWELPVNYPSTSCLSVVHWLADTIEKYPAKAEQFAGFVMSLPDDLKTKMYNFNCITKVCEEKPGTINMATLNSECFYENSLLNDHIWGTETAELRQKINCKRKELTSDKPSPFYAVLLMDGDKLGVLLSELDSASVSRALGRFSAQVENLVKKHNGVTVYAGGDDVLALLPMEDALEAAIELRGAYRDAFKQQFSDNNIKDDKATISAAIVYAQNHVPLKTILTQAHKLLDDVAKDKTGRDSLAITVWKASGQGLTWAAPWNVIIDGDSNIIDKLVNLFSESETEQSRFNSSFFYNLRKRFEILADNQFQFDRKAEVDLLTAEYLRNREREIEVDEAKQNIELLLRICHHSWREHGVLHQAEGPLTVDGALLIRFLASKGVHE